MEQPFQQPAAPATPAVPAPEVIAAAAPAPATQAMQDGGEAKSGFWDGVTILNVGIIALTTLALFYSIYYSRQRIFYLRNEKTQDRKDIEALKAQMQALATGQ